MRRSPVPADSGQSLTEFALVLPILIVLILGLFDFSRAMFYLNAVNEAARNGARIATVNQDSGHICTTVAEGATLLDLPTSCVGASTSPGITHVPGGNCSLLSECTQTVTVKAQFEPVIPVIGGIVGPVKLQSSSTVHVEHLCPAAGESACP
jgi:hypothetical protein